jgi:hypothetical protein
MTGMQDGTIDPELERGRERRRRELRVLVGEHARLKGRLRQILREAEAGEDMSAVEDALRQPLLVTSSTDPLHPPLG